MASTSLNNAERLMAWILCEVNDQAEFVWFNEAEAGLSGHAPDAYVVPVYLFGKETGRSTAASLPATPGPTPAGSPGSLPTERPGQTQLPGRQLLCWLDVDDPLGFPGS
jgi:hypothetical protein